MPAGRARCARFDLHSNARLSCTTSGGLASQICTSGARLATPILHPNGVFLRESTHLPLQLGRGGGILHCKTGAGFASHQAPDLQTFIAHLGLALQALLRMPDARVPLRQCT